MKKYITPAIDVRLCETSLALMQSQRMGAGGAGVSSGMTKQNGFFEDEDDFGSEGFDLWN